MTGFRLLSMVCIVMIFSMDQMLTTAKISCTNDLRQKGHTICSADSQFFTSSSMSENDKKTILDLHNELRGNVIPKATNMPKLYWDEQLAAVAEKKAKQCIMKHDTYPQRDIPEYGIAIGQNLAKGHHNWTHVINDWYQEIKDWKYGIGKLNKNPTGHFTQVVHSYASRVGCGYALCTNQYERFYACNYAAGQGPVKKPYESGERCSKCPDSCTNGLCDCKGKLCRNGGTLDVRTCTCKCQKIYTGLECEKLNCPKEDERVCPFITAPNACNAAGIKRKCPYMCGLCQIQGCENRYKTCKNGGKFDKSTCRCKCHKDRAFTGETCETVNCNVQDQRHCLSWGKALCIRYANVPGECPHMCGLCGGSV